MRQPPLTHSPMGLVVALNTGDVRCASGFGLLDRIGHARSAEHAHSHVADAETESRGCRADSARCGGGARCSSGACGERRGGARRSSSARTGGGSCPCSAAASAATIRRRGGGGACSSRRSSTASATGARGGCRGGGSGCGATSRPTRCRGRCRGSGGAAAAPSAARACRSWRRCSRGGSPWRPRRPRFRRRLFGGCLGCCRPPAQRCSVSLRNAIHGRFSNPEPLADLRNGCFGFGIQPRDFTLLRVAQLATGRRGAITLRATRTSGVGTGTCGSRRVSSHHSPLQSPFGRKLQYAR
jgi:hypothetical protein